MNKHIVMRKIFFFGIIGLFMATLLMGCESVPSQAPEGVLSGNTIVKRSVARGDEIEDMRSPLDVCNSLIGEVQSSNPPLSCKLVLYKKVDSGSEGWLDECVEGGSVAGCFACTFECK